MTETVDTGFAAVAAGEVYQPPEGPAGPTGAAPEPTPPVTATVSAASIEAMKSLVGLPDLTASQLARLARDMAMDIKEKHIVLKEHGLTQANYDFLEAYNTFYKAAYEAACIEWHAPLSTQERIKVEAAAILEDSLIGLGARMQNRAEGLPGVVEVAKLFAKVAGVGEREAAAGPAGERFVINIDLGGGKAITATSGEAPNSARQPAGAEALLPDGQGLSSLPPLRPLTEG